MTAAVETLAYNSENGVPWHGLGQPIDGLATAEEMMVAAGLDWEVKKVQGMYRWNNQVMDAKGRFYTIRESDGAHLGDVTDDYQEIQNQSLADLGLAMTSESDGELLFESAGSLQLGKRVFMLGKWPADLLIGGMDKLHEYILLHTRHDGLGALHVLPTSVRVICENTLNFAESGANMRIRITHNGNVDDKIPTAKRILGAYNKERDTFKATMDRLADTEFDAVDKLTEFIYPLDTGPAKQARLDIMDAYLDEQNGAHVELRGTAWQALNAVTGYVDHKSRSRGGKDGRFNYTLMGAGAEYKAQAVRYLTHFANEGELLPRPEPVPVATITTDEHGGVTTITDQMVKDDANLAEDLSQVTPAGELEALFSQ